MKIHCDPLGGWSGDMFAAAMLDALPDLWPDLRRTIGSLDLGAGARCELLDHRDDVLTGRRFVVAAEAAAEDEHQPHDHFDHHRHDHDGHHHSRHDHRHDPRDDESRDRHGHDHGRSWRSIRDLLGASRLEIPVKDRAIAIFQLLAEAEAEVHGVPVDAVSFHEVGAVDSIVDIVAAAFLIEAAGADGWSSAPLPLGSGRVKTAHGVMPVPAPATALLMRGLATIDDGVAGERVTPTGAAIARHLLHGRIAAPQRPRSLRAIGTGFGARRLPGLANCLRVLAFDEAAHGAGPAHRDLAVIAFEVDDQSAEELALGLERIRAQPGVHDVLQMLAFGKKGRMATQVQVLADPAALDAAIGACFVETTTIGLRHHLVHGAALKRRFDDVEGDARRLRVKIVERPGGLRTAKVEADDVAAQPGHAARARIRRAAEAEALARDAATRRD